jgi:hypothetical protein
LQGQLVRANDSDTRKFEPLKLPVESELRQPLITQLVWNDIQTQREKIENGDDESAVIDTEKYNLLFPGDGRQVKLVVRQASPQPWLTSRQIFFLVGLMTVPVFLYCTWRISVMKKELAQTSKEDNQQIPTKSDQ